MDTRILIVAFHFPPAGGAGTQRFAKFCKYLPDHGFRPIVLTRASSEHSESAPHEDASLDAGNPIEIARVPGRRPSIPERIARATGFYVDEETWACAAVREAFRLCERHRPACVVTTTPPYAMCRLGTAVRRRFGIPWVLDLRDPWALDGWRVFRSRLHLAYDLSWMRRALRAADRIIANTAEASLAYERLGADPSRLIIIPNGYDEADFQRPAPPAPARRDEPITTFRLVHTGTLHAIDRRPGLTRNRPFRVRSRQIDPLGRTGFYLLHALAHLRASDPSCFSALRVDLYGAVHPSHSSLVRDLALESTVTLHGYVAHAAATLALRGADAIFVPLHGVPPGERALVVPAKLYEALAAGRPILAAVPAGDAADLVRRHLRGFVVDPTDPVGIAEGLRRLILSPSFSGAAEQDGPSPLPALSRRALTQRLASSLRSLIDDSRRTEAPGMASSRSLAS